MSENHARPTTRPAAYYFSPSYRNMEPRVVLMVGSSWRPNMRAHYGLDGAPIFERAAYPGEPDHFPSSRHPWGWVFKPHNVLAYESASGMPPEQLAILGDAIKRELALVVYDSDDQRIAALQAVTRAAGASPRIGAPA